MGWYSDDESNGHPLINLTVLHYQFENIYAGDFPFHSLSLNLCFFSSLFLTTFALFLYGYYFKLHLRHIDTETNR